MGEREEEEEKEEEKEKEEREVEAVNEIKASVTLASNIYPKFHIPCQPVAEAAGNKSLIEYN